MAGLIAPTCVISRLRARDKRQVIEDLTRVACRTASLDVEAAIAAARVAADLPSFGPGRGVAIPHAMVAGLIRPVGAFARLDHAVAFDAADGEPVDLVLLLLGPEGRPGRLLRAMACVARRLHDQRMRQRLRGAAGAEALHALLTSESCTDRALDVPYGVAGEKAPGRPAKANA